VEIVNLNVRKCRSAISIRGYKDAPVREVRLRDCTFAEAAQPNVVENVELMTLENVSINGKRV